MEISIYTPKESFWKDEIHLTSVHLMGKQGLQKPEIKQEAGKYAHKFKEWECT